MQQSILVPLPNSPNFLENRWSKYSTESFWKYFPFVLMAKKPCFDISVYWDTLSNNYTHCYSDEEFMELASEIYDFMDNWVQCIPLYSLLLVVEVVDVTIDLYGLHLLVEKDEETMDMIKDGHTPIGYIAGSVNL